MAASLSPIAHVAELAETLTRLISPRVGEMSGRTEGGNVGRGVECGTNLGRDPFPSLF